jgi:hypothetical protein
MVVFQKHLTENKRFAKHNAASIGLRKHNGVPQPRGLRQLNVLTAAPKHYVYQGSENLFFRFRKNKTEKEDAQGSSNTSKENKSSTN